MPVSDSTVRQHTHVPANDTRWISNIFYPTSPSDFTQNMTIITEIGYKLVLQFELFHLNNLQNCKGYSLNLEDISLDAYGTLLFSSSCETERVFTREVSTREVPSTTYTSFLNAMALTVVSGPRGTNDGDVLIVANVTSMPGRGSWIS